MKCPCFVNNSTDISVLVGIFRNSIIKVPCIVNNTTDISVLIGFFRNSVNSVKVPCFVNLPGGRRMTCMVLFKNKCFNFSMSFSMVFLR